MQDPPPAAVRPSALVALVALVAGQGIGLVGLAVFFLVELMVASPTSAARARHGCAAHAPGRARPARGRPRAPAEPGAGLGPLPWSPSSWRCRWRSGLVQGGRWYVGVPLILWALGVLVLLFTPAVSEVLEE